MPRHVHERKTTVEPARKAPHHAPVAGSIGTESAFFFPGEAAQLLGLEELDYRQIRSLFVFIQAQRGIETPPGKWARFSLIDLVCLARLMPLLGGDAKLAHGERLYLRPVRQTVEWLRGHGIADPLLEVPMVRVGSRVLIEIDEIAFDPVTGQGALVLMERTLKTSTTADAIADRIAAAYEEARVELQGGASALRDLLVGPSTFGSERLRSQEPVELAGRTRHHAEVTSREAP